MVDVARRISEPRRGERCNGRGDAFRPFGTSPFVRVIRSYSMGLRPWLQPFATLWLTRSFLLQPFATLWLIVSSYNDLPLENVPWIVFNFVPSQHLKKLFFECSFPMMFGLVCDIRLYNWHLRFTH